MSEILERTLGAVGEGWITSEMAYVKSISTGRDYRYLSMPTEGELKEIHGGY